VKALGQNLKKKSVLSWQKTFFYNFIVTAQPKKNFLFFAKLEDID